MGPHRRNVDDVLARINFPLFTLQMLTNRHVLVGGGGGSSKTGVANGFEIFELSHDGKKFHVEEVTRHETGPNVVMNCAVSKTVDGKHTYLVAGQESHCQLYKVNTELVTLENGNIETIGHNHSDDKSELRERKPKAKQKNDAKKTVKKRLKFVLSPSESVQTDFNGTEPLCRVLRIHPNGKIMATGGTDGDVRIWKFPNLQPLAKLKGHSKEIDDIDFSTFGNYLITVAKDGLAILWDCVKGTEIKRLTWQQPKGSKYLYKRCRFAPIEKEHKSALYMLTNPTGVAKKQKSYLQQWFPEHGVIKRSAEFDESVSALAVRDDGRFVAVGTMFSGSVAIYASFSLQRILNIPGAHSMFVTGLEFLPVANQENHTVCSVAEAAVLSISVDNQVCIHTLPYRKTIPLWLAIVILMFTMFLTFLFCSYIDI
ncbi:prolactin regulatory element-binding protein [Anthonomus grandis grandis]|uniref:prolactin regulatory element-binding protein n=1 Tax=Anthonomus grandis grandis TaxID=2921223 RepID=UPI0021656756|nr:prolactin regulatory element-binding protein [Anthonomus grandis grandis]